MWLLSAPTFPTVNPISTFKVNISVFLLPSLKFFVIKIILTGFLQLMKVQHSSSEGKDNRLISVEIRLGNIEKSLAKASKALVFLAGAMPGLSILKYI